MNATSRARVRGSVLLSALVAGSVALTLATLLFGSSPSTAQSGGPPRVVDVSSNAGYTTVTVTFSEAAFTSTNSGSTPPGAGTGDLTASDFKLVSLPAGTDLASPTFSVSGSGTTWTLTFASAVSPNSMGIKVPANSVFNAAGAAFGEQTVAVPLSSAKLQELLAGLKAVDLPLDRTYDNGTSGDTSDDYMLSNLPFIGDWIANSETDRALTDLTAGLSGLTASSADSQLELELALEGLDAIETVTFASDQMTVDFAIDASPPTTSTTGDFGIEDLGISAENVAANVALTVDGLLTVKNGASGALIDTTNDSLTVGLSMTGTQPDMDARIGFADVKLDDPTANFTPSLALDLGCESGTACAPSSVTSNETLSGTGSFAVPSIDVNDGSSGGKVTFDPTSGDLFSASWSDLDDFADQSALVVTSTNFDALGLRGFNRLTMSDVLSGLGWLGSWLTELETYGALSTELPLIGGSVGELAGASGALGAQIEELAAEVEALVATSGAASLQDAVELLCDSDLVDLTDPQCGSVLTPVKIKVNSSTGKLQAIEYAIDLDADHTLFATDPPALELPLEDPATADPAEDPLLNVTQTGGTWSGTGTADFAFTLGLKTTSEAEIETELGLSSADFDGDLVNNPIDWDADGDGLDDAAADGNIGVNVPDDGADMDDDADGMPEHYVLASGDVCRGLATVHDLSPLLFAKGNGVLIDNAPAGAGDEDQIQDQSCDQLADVGTTVKTDATGTSEDVLDATEVCGAGAHVNGLTVAQFKTANSYATDAACATAVENAVDALYQSPPPTTFPTFSYDTNGKQYTSPVNIGHRIYVAADGTSLFDAELEILASELELDGTLGFLDLSVSSDDSITVDGDDYGLSYNPDVAVNLTDPGLGASDQKIDLAEIAEATDKGGATLASLVGFGITGTAEAHFLLENGLMPDDFHHDLLGDFSALDNPLSTTPVVNFEDHRFENTSADDYTTDRFNMGHDIGSFAESFMDLSATDMLQIFVNLADQVTALAGDDAMAQEIPFTGATVADAVGFAKSFADIAAGIEAGDPQTLSAFEQSLSDALRSVGMPGEITVHVESDRIYFEFDASRTVQQAYPFSLDPEDYGIPAGIPLLPADGGASIEVLAGMDFAPKVGILFDADELIADRIFVSDFAPSFSALIDGSLHGTINLGPFSTVLDGTLSVGDPGDDETVGTEDDEPITLGLTFDDGTDTTPLTIADLIDGLGDPADFISVEFGGPFAGELTVSQPPGELSVSGDVADLIARNFDEIDATATIDWSKVKLDLTTIVTGATRTVKWIGKLVQDSQAFATDIPLIGNKLTNVASVGQDMQDVADMIDAAWADANGAAEEFKDSLEDDLNTDLDTEFMDVTADLAWTDTDGELPEDEITSFGEAGGLLIDLNIAFEKTVTESLNGGLDLSPVMEIDASIEPNAKVGYALDIGLGVAVNKGFFVQGSDNGSLLQLYGQLGAQDFDIDPIKVGGVEVGEIVDADAAIGGTIGPEEDSAGFRVFIPERPGAEEGDVPRLTLADLVGKKKSADSVIDAEFEIDASIDLPIVTTFPKIPNLSIPLHFNWNANGSVTGGVSLEKPTLTLGSEDDDDQITLDVSDLLDQVVAPALDEINAYNPFAQVPQIKDTIDGNIPVFETTMRKIARQFVGNQPAWTLFEFLLDLDGLAADVRAAAANGAIKLGWVEVVGPNGFQKHPYDTPWYDQAGMGSLVDVLDNLIRSAGGNGTLKRPSSSGGSGGTQTQPTTANGPCPKATNGTTAPAPAGATSNVRPGRNIGKFGCLFSFPLLDDPMAAIGMVLGGDLSEVVSFVEFRPPPINVGPAISWSRTLFNLNTGFLDGSLTVGFDGALGLTIRLGFGFDSSGLLPGRFPLDGFYLIDFKDPSTGRDLQEVEIGGRVAGFIDGRFSVLGGLARASFDGAAGVNASAGIDFNDEHEAIPDEDRNDGRFHFREIIQVARAGAGVGQGIGSFFCPFAPSADLSAFLNIHGTASALGITVFDESWGDEWDILALLGIPKKIDCPPPARIAQITDSQLVLNDGPDHAVDRLENGVDGNANYSISQSGDDISVSWPGKPTLTFEAGDVDAIVGDLGEGNDTLTVGSGVTVPVLVNGGPGTDSITGGGGDDEIDGGPGADTVSGGPGVDHLKGGTGNDSLTGGAGDDLLEGGDSVSDSTSNDTYNFADGWGTDSVEDPDGTETFNFTATSDLTGTSDFGEALITDGTNSVGYFADEIDVILSGSGDDDYTLKSDLPQGFHLEGGGGDDEMHVEYMGQHRTISIEGNAGTDLFEALGTPGPDLFLSRGKSSTTEEVASKGFLAMIADQAPEDEDGEGQPIYDPDDDQADRVDYDNTFESLEIKALTGNDHVVFDDNAAPTEVDGGEGNDRFQVGQIFENLRDVANGGLDADDVMATEDTTRGYLSKGVSHATTINGNFFKSDVDADNGEYVPCDTEECSDKDFFQVYSNKAELDLNGNEDDDTFVVRAFVLEDSVELGEPGSTIGDDVDLGGGLGSDKFDYVNNELVNVDGGTGFDTFVIVGTEFGDGFLINDDGIRICPIAEIGGKAVVDDSDDDACAVTATYVNIERLVGQGLEGDDLFQIESTTSSAVTTLFGGENPSGHTRDSDRFVVGNEGDVTEIDGPLRLRGEQDPEFDPSIADPIVLPGEDQSGSVPSPFVGNASDAGDGMLVDASAHTGDDTGAIDFDPDGGTDGAGEGNVTGLGLYGGGEVAGETFGGGIQYADLENAVVQLGSGADTFDVESTHSGVTTVRGGEGGDTVNVKTIDGNTRVRGEGGGDTVNAGDEADEADPSGRVDFLAALLDVYGGDGDDEMYVDDTGDVLEEAFYSDQIEETVPGGSSDIVRGKLTGLGLDDAGIHYDGLELVDVGLGSDDDVVNVRGTTTETVVHGNGGDELFYVSSGADYDENDAQEDFLEGHLDDVDGDLQIDSGDGTHVLSISDSDDADADTATLDEDSLVGMSDGDITYDSDAVDTESTGDYAGGITVWNGTATDVMTFDGARTDDGMRVVTTLNANEGDDEVDVNLTEGTDGAAVVNLEAGADDLDGTDSSAPLIVFGDDGADEIDTGSGDDIVLGDVGHVRYRAAHSGADLTVHGGGGPGDITDGADRAVSVIESDHEGTDSDDDTINSGAGDDKVIGGGGTDTIDGEADDDDVLGDSARYDAAVAEPLIWESLWRTYSDRGADDDLEGGSGDDWLLGQHGTDTINGDADDDIAIGGHQHADGLDTNDTIHGDGGDDAIYGDNAEARPGTTATLLNVEAEGSPVSATLHGADDLFGDADEDAIFGQGDGDDLDGGTEDDYLEGNHGHDAVFGGAHDDDIIGGGSAADGRLDLTRSGVGLLDETDELYGDEETDGSAGAADGEDVILGDNGGIARTGSSLDPVANAEYQQRALRTVTMADTTAGVTSGSDVIRGNGGDDELYGQLDDTAGGGLTGVGCGTDTGNPSGDLLCGDGGVDALIGDLGVVTVMRAGQIQAPDTVVTQSPFLLEPIYDANSLVYRTVLQQTGVGGRDVLFGGPQDDALHGGAEIDWLNAGSGDDAVFGDDNHDRAWGGPGHDRMYGGHGMDDLDVKTIDNGLAWFWMVPLEDRDNSKATTNGRDTIYGGWDADILQADEGDAGQIPGDRLMDWSGSFNLYSVCEGALGAGRVVREFSPEMEVQLPRLAAADGASGSSAGNELAFVTKSDVKSNTKPRHPAWPGNFTCEQLP